jgi:hypothetical protein
LLLFSCFETLKRATKKTNLLLLFHYNITAQFFYFNFKLQSKWNVIILINISHTDFICLYIKQGEKKWQPRLENQLQKQYMARGGYFQSIAVYTFGRFKAEEPVCIMRVLEWILILCEPALYHSAFSFHSLPPICPNILINLSFANIFVCVLNSLS